MSATTDKQIRLECLRQAVLMAVAFKHPKESIIGVAKQYHGFVTGKDETEDETEADEIWEGGVRIVASK